ncbi:MAG: response regulator transcription factor [Spirochaetia bacterium]
MINNKPVPKICIISKDAFLREKLRLFFDPPIEFLPVFLEAPKLIPEFSAYVLPYTELNHIDRFQRMCFTPLLCYGPPNFIRQAITLGCADYLTEPLHPEELAARVLKAIADAAIQNRGNEFTGLASDGFYYNGKIIDFTHHELIILSTLWRNQNLCISKETLCYVLEETYRKESRKIDMHIANIRKKCVREGAMLSIRGIRNKGYILKTGM